MVVSIACDAEIGDLERAAGGQDQVGRLDVAMHDAARVREFERLQELRRDRDELPELEARLAVQVLAQPGAVDVLHRDERDLVVLAVFVDARRCSDDGAGPRRAPRS